MYNKTTRFGLGDRVLTRDGMEPGLVTHVFSPGESPFDIYTPYQVYADDGGREPKHGQFYEIEFLRPGSGPLGDADMMADPDPERNDFMLVGTFLLTPRDVWAVREAVTRTLSSVGMSLDTDLEDALADAWEKLDPEGPFEIQRY